MNRNLGWKWILVVGGFGFLTGFLGPIIFAPEANQGPLLGIFITGPLGVFAGIVLWTLSTLRSWSYDLQTKIAATCCGLFVLGLVAVLKAPKPEWLGRSYEIEVTACTQSSPNEIVLSTTILRETIFKVEKPLFGPSHIWAGRITTARPQQLSFYKTGSCAEFPTGYKGEYYVDNHPAVSRDKAVLLPIPERLKGIKPAGG